jgi:hypothetical protein
MDLSRRPLAGRDLAVEENVNLAVTAVLHLRQEEVCHNEAEEAGTRPDVTTLAAKVCFL